MVIFLKGGNSLDLKWLCISCLLSAYTNPIMCLFSSFCHRPHNQSAFLPVAVAIIFTNLRTYLLIFCSLTDVFHRVRGQHNSPDTNSYEQQARTPSSMTALHFDSLPSPSTDHTETAASDSRNNHKPARVGSTKRLRGSSRSDNASKLVTKRLRLSDGERENRYLRRSLEPDPGAITSIQTRNLPLTPSEDTSDVAGSHDFDAHIDPYFVDSDLTLHYMDLFFLHMNAGSYRLFPSKAFLQWMQMEKQKSRSELSVVYAMLALASVYSSREDSSTDGRTFARIAEIAVERTRDRLDLQLVQTRMLLAIYHSALGGLVRASEFCALAVNATACLKLALDQESVVDDDNDDDISTFGLHGSALVECQRRTYWSVFLLDVSRPHPLY